MKAETKTIITAIAAAIFTIVGLDIAIVGLKAGIDVGYGFGYLMGALAVPAILWLATFDFYQKSKKENKQTA